MIAHGGRLAVAGDDHRRGEFLITHQVGLPFGDPRAPVGCCIIPDCEKLAPGQEPQVIGLHQFSCHDQPIAYPQQNFLDNRQGAYGQEFVVLAHPPDFRHGVVKAPEEAAAQTAPRGGDQLVIRRPPTRDNLILVSAVMAWLALQKLGDHPQDGLRFACYNTFN